MGFFDLKATCGCCGKTCRLNRYLVKKSDAWVCPECFKLAGGFNLALRKMTIEEVKQIIQDKSNVKSTSTLDSALTQKNISDNQKIKVKVKEYKRGRSLPESFVIFDLETTGLSPEQHEIIEIGAIKYVNGIETERFHTYVKPDSPITSQITKINGITNSMVKDAPKIDTAIKSFENFIESLHLVAHNASFDMGFIQTNMNYYHDTIFDNKVIDTLTLSRKYIETPNHKLETLKKHFRIDVGSHNAIDDCVVCAKVYMHCKEKCNV